MAIWRWGRTRPDLTAVVAFAVAACSVVLLGLVSYPHIGLIDEGVHLDYVRTFPHVPQVGEHLTQETLRDTACLGYGSETKVVTPRCRPGDYDPAAFPGGGYSYGGQTPPLYYAVGQLARPLAAVGSFSLFTALRLVNTLWLFATMCLGYLIGRRLGAPRAAAAAAALLLGTSQGAVYAFGAAGPDAAVAVVGGALVLAALTVDGSRRGWVIMIALGVLAALSKQTAFTAVGAAGLIVLGRVLVAPRAERPYSWRHAWSVSLSTGLVFVIGTALWLVRYARTALLDPDELPISQAFQVSSLDGGAVRSMALRFLLPIDQLPEAPMPAFLDGVFTDWMAAVVRGVVVLGLLACVLVRAQDRRPQVLATAVLVMALVGPVLLMLLNYYANHQVFSLSPRYGFGLLAAMAGITAAAFRAPGHRRALMLLATLSWLFVLTGA